MKSILVNSGLRYDKVALLSDNKLIDFYINDHAQINHADNIYFGIVRDSVKKFDSVFIDIGEEKNAYMQKDNTDKLPLEGEKVMVQVIKDDTDTKGPSLSTNITLVGRYAILVVNKSGKNIPKSKIMFSNNFDKSKIDDLRKDLEKVVTKEENIGIVVRTEAVGVDSKHIKEDYVNLFNKYTKLEEDFKVFKENKKDKQPKLVYAKDALDIVINEFYDNETSSIICDKEEMTEKIKENMNDLGLDSSIVKTYDKDSKLTLFETYKVDDELKKALGKYAWLKSGGQIIIEHTEALTVIDVNSKKCEGKKEIEESSLKVNLEAASEIARQIRLRNISGIILIDFINMKSSENQDKVIKELKKETSKDKLQVNVLGMTKLGLCELTRQKKRKMLKDILK